MAGESGIVGRSAERARLAESIEQSARGTPSALLVCGEAGVGKTSLVTAVTEEYAARGHLVLWGRCLRFGADSSPYLPIGQLLTTWHRQAESAERVRVLAGAEGLATIAPALATGMRSGGGADHLISQAATAIDRITEGAPTVLVVDDLQWADTTSLDLLAYVLAGMGRGQRLAVLGTYRDTDLDVGHRLHGWLADVRRLPAVSQIRLQRLGLPETEELVARLRGDGSSRLAEEVFDKAGGNPYYTELLMRGSVSGAGTEPDDDLQQALLGSWHRLGPESRELLQLLALAGRPVAVAVLERLVDARGGAPETVAASLAEATAAGLATVAFVGEAWFHHPLIAEVVATTLTPTARRQVHKQYVEVLESAADLTTASRAAHLALHHHGAGDPDQAFTWSLRAADEAAAVRGYAEVCDHLHRACRLWEDVSDDVRATAADRTDLWQRASKAAWRAGEYLLAVRLREEAIAHDDADGNRDPARAVQLRLPLLDWRVFCGLDAGVTVEAARAVLQLAESRCPGTPEHVRALVQQSHAEVWDGDYEGAAGHAAAAVRMARRTGSPEAVAWALGARSQTPPWEHALADATGALALAHEVGDPLLLAWTTTRTANRLDVLGRDHETADLLLTTFRQLVEAGSVREGMFAGAHWGAFILLDLGQWEEAREILRWLLSQRLPAGPGAVTRGVAALLALRTGDVPAGRAHLARMRELHPGTPRPGELLDHVEVEAHWALGQPRAALCLTERLMPDKALLDPAGADELLVIAARAAGDLAERPGGRDEAVALLDRVERLRAQVCPMFERTGPEDVVHLARESLFAADRARCHGARDTVGLWRTAALACRAAEMPWHEALAQCHLARSLFAARGGRGEAATALGAAAELAERLGAKPILDDVDALANHARIVVQQPRRAGGAAAGWADSPVWSSLTEREREVLDHLVTGRTYSEIAAALYISRKTVSVHVSNILRKTGTTSRIEVADLARRLAGTP